MICQKCNCNLSTVQLRKKDYYCEKCFLTNINHKFRACIGKNKLFSSEEKVLICLSGGEGSTVMLNLIYNSVCLENHKKLRIKPLFIHLYEDNTDIAEQILKECIKYDFVVYIVQMSDNILTKDLPEANTLPKSIQEINSQANLLRNVPPTAFKDLLAKIKRTLYIKYAKILQCNYIFTGETTTTLASNLLSSIALGRGSQVGDDIGFLDNRDENIKIVRPMKDINKEELYYYIKVKQLILQHHNEVKKNSLQVLINNFVTDLQENFPSTISTICKTADKLGVLSEKADDKTSITCKICESPLKTDTEKLTALQATEFSRLVSFQSPTNSNTDADVLRNVQENQNSMFPHINKHLCYSCSRNYLDADECRFTQYVDKLLLSPIIE